MQTRIWKMHPAQKLPDIISMWSPPTFPNITRFGQPLFHQQINMTSKIYYQSQERYSIYAGKSEDTISIYARQIEIERQESSARALEELMIPGQPRKQFTKMQQDAYAGLKSQVSFQHN